jgi:stage II sporulation protein D
MATNADINILVNGRTVKTQLSQVKVITAKGEKSYDDPNQEVNVVSADGTTKTVTVSPTAYDFTGRGWGHSVGLSQEGTKGMAKAGFTYDQILSHYYPGTEIGLKN